MHRQQSRRTRLVMHTAYYLFGYETFHAESDHLMDLILHEKSHFILQNFIRKGEVKRYEKLVSTDNVAGSFRSGDDHGGTRRK